MAKELKEVLRFHTEFGSQEYLFEFFDTFMRDHKVIKYFYLTDGPRLGISFAYIDWEDYDDVQNQLSDWDRI